MLSPNDRRIYAVAIAGLIFAGLLAWATASPFTPLNPPQNFRNCPANCSAQKQTEPVGFWQAVETEPVAVFTLLLVAVTVWLAFATNRAANAAKVAAEHIPRVERAYMFTGVKDGIKKTANGNLVVDLDIANYGKTPGILREACIAFSQNIPTEPDYTSGEARVTDVVLASGEHIKPGTGSTQWISPFTKAHFAFGYIIYLDVFRREQDPHFTRFCLLIRPGTTADNGTFEVRGTRELNSWT